MNSLPAGYIPCGTENQTCTATGTNTVYYGAGDKYYSKQMTGPFTCGLSTFDNQDPDPGVAKMCYLPWPNLNEANSEIPTDTTLMTSLPSGYTVCGKEGGQCNTTGTRLAYYGAGGKYFTKYVQGPFTCSIGFFGADPNIGVNK